MLREVLLPARSYLPWARAWPNGLRDTIPYTVSAHHSSMARANHETNKAVHFCERTAYSRGLFLSRSQNSSHRLIKSFPLVITSNRRHGTTIYETWFHHFPPARNLEVVSIALTIIKSGLNFNVQGERETLMKTLRFWDSAWRRDSKSSNVIYRG